MDGVEVSGDAGTGRYSVVLTQGSDTVRCMVTVATGGDGEARPDDEMRGAALSAAKGLARALDAAIQSS